MKYMFILSAILLGILIILGLVSCSLLGSKVQTKTNLGKKKVSGKLEDLKTNYDRGVYYYEKKDYKQALEWFKKATDQGNANAQTNLGGMYFEGQGVSKNLIYAYSWFYLALSNGYSHALKVKNRLEGMMSPDQIVKAKKLSSQMAQKINKN